MKKKVAVIFGGRSTEHEVSRISAYSIIKNIDRELFDIVMIGVTKQGEWLPYNGDIEALPDGSWEKSANPTGCSTLTKGIEAIETCDVILPVLHGQNGEDGTVQGLFELMDLPYVGCGVFASAACMDKVYTKIIFEKAGIPQAKYIYIKRENDGYNSINDKFEEEKLDLEKIIKEIGFPMFVKPSNSGSSVGVKKATNREELKMAIENAGKYDRKILVEQGINAKEVECAVLDDKEVKASTVGEIQAAEEFYSFDAKYNMPESKTIIPAEIKEEQIETIRKLAIKAFKAIDGKGLARVDFFIDKETEKIYINEINTMPGFTKISMYPKLFEAVGISYSDLLDKLVQNALK